jgi:hypothetical protein
MSKSFVTLEQKKCLVTGKDYDSGSLLLDKRLKNKFEHYTCTGWGISPEVQEKINEGYIPLVVCDPKKSIITDGRTKPEDAYRTGEVIYLKRHVAEDMFNVENLPEFTFIDEEMRDVLQKMKDNAED